MRVLCEFRHHDLVTVAGGGRRKLNRSAGGRRRQGWTRPHQPPIKALSYALVTDSITMLSCGSFNIRLYGVHNPSPPRKSCCCCGARTFEKVCRTVSYPCDFKCSVCYHQIVQVPPRISEVYKICEVCRHSCFLCCGDEGPKDVIVDLDCGACLAKTKYRLYAGDQRSGLWASVSKLTVAGNRRWNEACGGCRYNPAPFRLFALPGYRVQRFRVVYDFAEMKWKLEPFTKISVVDGRIVYT